MSHRSLLLVTVLAAGSRAAPQQTVLENSHLIATFQHSESGPRLTQVKDLASGASYRFDDDQAISIFAVQPSSVHDPALEVNYALQSDLEFDGIEIDAGGDSASVHFHSALMRMTVEYTLDANKPVLGKTILCKAGESGAYVAGVRQWTVKPVGMNVLWPKKHAWGQPAVLAGEGGGCILTLEWPSAETDVESETISLSYRPGYHLGPGQGREVATGSLIVFQSDKASDALDVARHTFFEHVRDRVKPQVPFPVKFTTWGPWLRQAREDRALAIMDDLGYVECDLFHFDAGWQWPDHPYSQRMPAVLDADDATWDREMTLPERLPNGLLPLVRAAEANGMKLSLWFDASGHVFVREGETWAARDENGQPIYRRMWEGRWPEKPPAQSLASEYGDRLRSFVLETLHRYDLGGVMFDNNHYPPDRSPDHDCLANGWDAADVQLRRIMEIFDACQRRRPGIYRFFCHAASWPWALKHATHIHAGDPGISGKMREAIDTDYPARALAYERRLAWKRHYDNFVPPWGVKGDIAGWSVQQMSPIPINLEHNGHLIPAGEGWTQNMFTCFATTAVRDIRFAFEQMPHYDRDILKEWLAWDRRRSQFIFNCRPLFEMPQDPNEGIVGFSHVGQGQGVMYLFNTSFETARAHVTLDESAGFRPEDLNVPSFIVYPMKAQLGTGRLSWGDDLNVPIAGKDCVVIEVGLGPPDAPVAAEQYEQAVARVRRSYDAIQLTSFEQISESLRQGPMRLEVGDGVCDRRVAAQILETLGASIGQRLDLAEVLGTPGNQARCRLIIGTHEGLSSRPGIGKHFRETMYSRYIDWNNQLISAPLVTDWPGTDLTTYCLIAPRPEQLARLAVNLTTHLLEQAPPAGAELAEKVWTHHALTATVPADRPILRFRPLMNLAGAITFPGDLALVRYEIHAEHEGRRIRLWSEDIPPFYTIRGDGGWWQDRTIALTDLAGKQVTFHFTAGHVDGRTEPPRAEGGFDHIALLNLMPQKANP